MMNSEQLGLQSTSQRTEFRNQHVYNDTLLFGKYITRILRHLILTLLVNVPNIDFHNTTFNAGVSPKVSNEPN